MTNPNDLAKQARRKVREQTFRELPSLEALLRHLQIPERPIPILLFGDGSATTWATSAGWACTLVDLTNFDRIVFSGGMSHGTNNLAELLAYLAPLMWLAKTVKERPYGTHVRILSDSQYIVEGFNGVSDPYRANGVLWEALRGLKQRGVKIQAHWIPRGCIALNELADQLAGMCRLANGPDGVAAAVLSQKNVYELNPHE